MTVNRKEVNEYTWDLTYIYENDSLIENDYNLSLSMLDNIKTYEGKITKNIQTFKKFLKDFENLSTLISKIYVYSHLKHDKDTTNSVYQEMYSKAVSLLNSKNEALSYVTTEYLENSSKIIEYLNSDKELEIFKHYFDELFLLKDHTLSKSDEKLVSNLGEILYSGYETYNTLCNADMSFPDVDGEKIGNENFTSKLGYIKDREKRRKIYETYYNEYHKYGNTFAKTLSTNVKVNNILARIKKYDSARHASMGDNFIEKNIYDNLIEVVNNNLEKLHEYMSYKAKVLGYDKLYMYDMYISISKSINLKFSVEEGKKLVLEALKPLGKEYLSIVQKCYDENWIDFMPNKGKVSGAYSSGSYTTRPHILMSWQNNIDSVYTLAHEIGHSIHSYYTRHTQPYVYGEYTTFLAEIASTTNENLLTQYLLEKYKDDKEVTNYILNKYLDGFRATVFRQTQFAEFEDLIHNLEQSKEVLTKDRLCKEYFEINKKYYGKDVVTDNFISVEWARIPHFYYNFYVYQYATGFSCAVAFAKDILENKEVAVERYINYLKSGSSANSIEILKRAGLDVRKSEVFEKALKEFSDKLELLKIL